jgi:hypothetical protein
MISQGFKPRLPAARGRRAHTGAGETPTQVLMGASAQRAHRRAGVTSSSAMRELGYKGIVSKRLGSPYVSGRSRHWVMCGRRLIDKSFLTLMQHWSGAVMCPAC